MYIKLKSYHKKIYLTFFKVIIEHKGDILFYFWMLGFKIFFGPLYIDHVTLVHGGPLVKKKSVMTKKILLK